MGEVAEASAPSAREPRFNRRARSNVTARSAASVPASIGADPPWAVRALQRRRVQLTIALLIGALLPALFRWPLEGAIPVYAGFDLSDRGSMICLAGSCFAILAGFITLRQLHVYPGVNSIGYVLYAFGLTFAALAIGLLLSRAEYARYQLCMSFGLTLVWFLFVQRLLARRTRLRFAVIPPVKAAAIPQRATIDWMLLKEPQVALQRFDGVVANLSAHHSPDWERLMARCALAGVPVFDLKQISESLTGRVTIGQLSENTLGATLNGLVYAKLKRGLDIVLCVLFAPAFILALVVAGAAIKADDGGEIFFRQMRMGYRGRPFTIWKLRTMRAAEGGEAFTSKSDPRITRVGGFLRKYRIDEFPQIWNILIGQMSWIGPRPEALALAEWYEAEVPYYCYRHMVRPGITGWAQVHQGNVAKVDAATEKLQYDFYYIKNLSPWLDLLIILKTIQTILTGFGAL